MKNTAILVIIFSGAFFVSCKKKTAKNQLRKIDIAFIDSVVKKSDSTYTKNYKRPDFATADYYVNKTDSTVCQIMCDSAKRIRQVIISRNDIRTYFAQYYAGGQLQADLKFDDHGQYNGPAVYYYENGNIKSTGNYKNGLSTGEWKEFDEKGKATVIKYGSNGTRII